MVYNVITKLRQGGVDVKPIEKKFCRFGNSKGIVLDKIVFIESEIKPTDEVQITCGKGRITIKKKKEKEN